MSDDSHRDPNAPAQGPDAVVLQIENQYDASLSGINALSNLSITGQPNTYPARPGHGTAGNKVDLYANYFSLKPKNDFVLGRYNVEISGELAPKKRKQLFRLLLQLPEFAGAATDYSSMLISMGMLNIPDNYEIDIPWRNEREDEVAADAKTYRVRIVAPTSLDIGALLNYLSTNMSNNAIAQQKGEMMQAMNTLMGFYALRHDGITSIGHNRHFSTDRVRFAHNVRSLGGGLEALRGFFQSVRPATGRLLLNVNVSHSVFLTPGRLVEVFGVLGSGDPKRLADKIRYKRVKLLHLPEKKTNAGLVIPREKSINGLAQPSDGRNQQHPPQVPKYGAGPKEVKFWIDSVPSKGEESPKAGKKGGGKKAAGSDLPVNTYISVFDYFKKSEISISAPQCNPSNILRIP
jgi:eukaryotic translation initiation factor 2C